MHSQKAESIGMCFLPQSESSPIITRHRRAAVQHLRDIPTRQRFGQRTGVRRRKYGRSSAPPSGNASTSYSLVDASTRPSVVPFGTPREPFPARRRAGTRRSAHRRSTPPRHSGAPALRPAYRHAPSQARPFRSVAEQKRKSPRFMRSRRFPASTHPSAVLSGTPREPFPARRRAGTRRSARRRSIPPRHSDAPALRPAYRRTPSQVRPFQRAAERKRKYFILSRRCFHSPVRGSLRYTARTVPGAPSSRNA